MDMLLGILIEWLALNTSIEIQSRPEVVIMSPAELDKKYGAPVHALYSHEEGIVYLSESVDLETIRGASVLLHELVHHYQNISGAMANYNCIQESEKLAYKTQKEYLLANKAELMPELSSEFTIFVRSMCQFD